MWPGKGFWEVRESEELSHSRRWVKAVSDCWKRIMSEGAKTECVFSDGLPGIPSDKTWALFSYGAGGEGGGGGGDDV